jgi:superfamily I DNA/RNA helicase
LTNDRYSNLGWRIIAEFILDDDSLINIVTESENNVRIVDLLPKEIVDHQNNILDIIVKISVDDTFDNKYLEAIKSISPENAEEIILMFKYKNEEQKEIESAEDDKQKQTSILLTSYQGAKGLSGGHVFVVGLHNKSLPKNEDHISDIEISQFLVAITRTRKKLHLISNKWFKNPMTKDGKFMSPYERSIFIDWIPDDMINNRGSLKSEDLT